MPIIAATNEKFLSFNVGNYMADLLPMKLTCKRCHMKETPVRVQNENQIIPAEDMVSSLLNSQFLGDNLNQASNSFASSLLAAGRSGLYAFVAKPENDWNKLLMLTAKAAFKQVEHLKSHKEHYLIFDDTVLEHTAATSMELATYTFNHNTHNSVKGYTCLQGGWSDGISFFPSAQL